MPLLGSGSLPLTDKSPDGLRLGDRCWTSPGLRRGRSRPHRRLFTGVSPRQFSKLLTALWREGADPVREGLPWSLLWRTGALPVPACRQTNLTLRQLAPALGVSVSGQR